MSFNKSITAMILVSGALASSGSLAQEPTSLIGCVHLAKQVASALEANPQSPNYQAARDAQAAGRNFCELRYFGQGIASYEKALTYLGQQVTKN
jgi:hypothetical protein